MKAWHLNAPHPAKASALFPVTCSVDSQKAVVFVVVGEKEGFAEDLERSLGEKSECKLP